MDGPVFCDNCGEPVEAAEGMERDDEVLCHDCGVQGKRGTGRFRDRLAEKILDSVSNNDGGESS